MYAGTIGLGLILGQERPWTFEGYLDWQQPFSTSASGGNTFSTSSAVAADARVGAAYKIAPNWRLGAFLYVQSHSYDFTYTDKTTAVTTSGKQSLFYSTLDFHLGYEL
jgi:hypothetical protein